MNHAWYEHHARLSAHPSDFHGLLNEWLLPSHNIPAVYADKLFFFPSSRHFVGTLADGLGSFLLDLESQHPKSLL
jgi:hypothetical protein